MSAVLAGRFANAMGASAHGGMDGAMGAGDGGYGAAGAYDEEVLVKAFGAATTRSARSALRGSRTELTELAAR